MNTLKWSIPAGIVVALIMLSPAHATSVAPLITFDDQPFGSIAGQTLTIVAGDTPVTFSGTGLQIRSFGGSFPDTLALSTFGDSEVITVTFGGRVVQFVEFENFINGRYTDEVDFITGTAFNAAGHVVDMTTNADTIFRLEGPGITRVVYDDDNFGGGYLIDNFRFLVVPEPTSSALVMGTAACVLVFPRRRRSSDGLYAVAQ
jgi:hypothetical protein